MISLISGYAAVLVDGLDLAWAQRRISATRVHPGLFAERPQGFPVVAFQPKERGLGAVVRPDDVVEFHHGAVLCLAPATDMRHDLFPLGSVDRDPRATPNARRSATPGPSLGIHAAADRAQAPTCERQIAITGTGNDERLHG